MEHRRTVKEFNPEKVLAGSKKKAGWTKPKAAVIWPSGLRNIVVLSDEFKALCLKQILEEQPTLRTDVANQIAAAMEHLKELIPEEEFKLNAKHFSGVPLGFVAVITSKVLKRGLKDAGVKVSEQVFQSLLFDLAQYVSKQAGEPTEPV